VNSASIAKKDADSMDSCISPRDSLKSRHMQNTCFYTSGNNGWSTCNNIMYLWVYIN